MPKESKNALGKVFQEAFDFTLDEDAVRPPEAPEESVLRGPAGAPRPPK